MTSRTYTGEEEEENSIVFSVTADSQTYSLRMSEAWLVASTHARVNERLDRLQACRKMREHGAAYVEVTKTGQELWCSVRPGTRAVRRLGQQVFTGRP